MQHYRRTREIQEEKVLPFDCRLRQSKYLTNLVEQGRRFIRRRWRSMQCFRSCRTAERMLEGAEALHMLHEGQVKRLDGKDARGQAKFVVSPFEVAA